MYIPLAAFPSAMRPWLASTTLFLRSRPVLSEPDRPTYGISRAYGASSITRRLHCISCCLVSRSLPKAPSGYSARKALPFDRDPHVKLTRRMCCVIELVCPLGFRDDALRTFVPIFCFAIAGTNQGGSWSFLVCVIPDILIVALLTPFLPDQSWSLQKLSLCAFLATRFFQCFTISCFLPYGTGIAL